MGNKLSDIISQPSDIPINKIYNILLAGPTGVGKTFLINQLSAIRKYDQGGQLIQYQFYDKKGMLNQLNFTVKSSDITKQDLDDIDGIIFVCSEDVSQIVRFQQNLKKLIKENKIDSIPQYLIRTSIDNSSDSRTQVSDQGEIINVRQTAISLLGLINHDPSMNKTNEVKRTFLKIYQNLSSKKKNSNKSGCMVYNKYSLIFDLNLYRNDVSNDDDRINSILMDIQQFN